jgi:hypothetical protein
MGKGENTFSVRDAVGTPPKVFNLIEQVLGPIGLDPCSHPGSEVPARIRYYLPQYAPPGMPQGVYVPMAGYGRTPAHHAMVGDGLVLPWGPGMGLVYVNPPYNPLDTEPWILRALSTQAAFDYVRNLALQRTRRLEGTPGCPDELVWLLPVRTAGSWWQTDLVQVADVITFLNFRVHHTGEDSTAPFHQCLAYRGPRAEMWARAMRTTQIEHGKMGIGHTIQPRQEFGNMSLQRFIEISALLHEVGSGYPQADEMTYMMNELVKEVATLRNWGP